MARFFAPFPARVLILFVALLAAASSTALAEPPVNYNGTYELAGNRTDRVFSLDVKQAGSRAKINFTASMADGSGAAPDAMGDGRIEDGVLSFRFKDSFANEGKGKLQVSKGIYQLDMVVTKVVDTAPLHFYASVLLTRISKRTISP
jgi:hypothetical protein